ncbi:MAG: NUDIX domain-containing protein [Candidatus Woesearchaeota archaeon]
MKTTTNAFIFYENKLLVVHHKKLKIWIHPGGHVEQDESFFEAIKREIKEEVGLDVEIISNDKFKISNYENIQNEPIPFIITVSKNKRAIRLDYLAKTKTHKIILQKEELLDYKWIDKKEINQLDTTQLFKELAHEAFRIIKEIK